MRRYLPYIAGVVVILGLVLLGVVYFLFYRGSATLTTSSGNPFGEASGTNSTATGQTTQSTDAGEDTPTVVAPKLVEITPGPVAKGFLVLDNANTDASTTGPDTEVRYIRRDSGNMFSYLVNAQTIERLSNKTIPGIQQAAWLPGGSEAFVQYVSIDSDNSQHIQTYALPVPDDGYFLEQDLSEVSTVGSTTIFTLLPTTGGSTGTIASADGTSTHTVFSSLLSHLMVFTPNASTMIAETAPSYGTGGYAFLVGSDGTFTQLLGPTSALEVLPSPSGDEMLATSVDGGGMHMVLVDLKTHAVTSLALATLAEKCVWTADSSAIYCAVPNSAVNGTIPDDWFKGTVSFTDQIWRMDLVARVADLVVDLPTLSSSPIDAVSLTIDPQTSILAFMNERDGSLWAYDLSQ